MPYINVKLAGNLNKDQKKEIAKDLSYLITQWNKIRQLTIKSEAPELIYEEGNIWSMIIIIMLLFIVLYVAIAYYDYIYDCNPKLKRGYYSITGAFKPPNTEPTTCEQSLKDEHNTLRSIHLMHLFIVAPMLTYAGIIGYKHVTGKSTINTNLSSQLFTVLAATGGVTALYHGYRFINPRL